MGYVSARHLRVWLLASALVTAQVVSYPNGGEWNGSRYANTRFGFSLRVPPRWRVSPGRLDTNQHVDVQLIHLAPISSSPSVRTIVELSTHELGAYHVDEFARSHLAQIQSAAHFRGSAAIGQLVIKGHHFLKAEFSQRFNWHYVLRDCFFVTQEGNYALLFEIVTDNSEDLRAFNRMVAGLAFTETR